MNIVVKSALASAALAFAYACANPVEIDDDVQVVNPNAFGDGGVPAGAGGDVGQGGASQGGASQGGTGAGLGGTTSGSSGGGVGGAGVGGGMPAGLSGAGGLPGSAGAGGTATGTGGSGAGAGGTSGGAAGTTAGTGGTAAGTGGTGSAAVFDASSCDFDDTAGCDTLACQARCPTNDGNSCLNRCVAVVNCVIDEVDDPEGSCVTAADPLCGGRDVGQARACTALVESAGGVDPNPPSGTQAPQPSFVAREFVECICSLPRP